MTMTTPLGLTERIEQSLLATPGIRDVYRSGSLASNLLDAGATALGIRAETDPIVTVTVLDGGEVNVEASVGIEYSVGAAEVLRSARAAIDEIVRGDGMSAAAITLTVAYVHPREAS